MFQVNMVGYLWDLVDEGLESALDMLQGCIGVTGLGVPITSGPGQHLRYGPDVSPRVFQTRGGVFFQPDKALYENTRCKPALSEWLKTRDPLAKLSRQCHDRKLRLRAVIECTHLGRSAARDPHFARKNVFGDVSMSQVCLVNPNVAEFLRAVAADACRNYSVETVELTGLDAMTPSTGDARHAPGLGGRQLLALCFCESCRQSAATAGVDVEMAARSAMVRLEAVFRTGQPIEPPLAALAVDDQPLASFITWYRDRITELMGNIRNACGCQVVSHTRPLKSEAELTIDAGCSRGADAVVCDYSGSETAPLERLIEQMRGVLERGQRVEVQLPVCPADAGDDQALVRILTRLAELGIVSANLDHYGCLPRDRIDLVKQAVRFARRTSQASA